MIIFIILYPVITTEDQFQANSKEKLMEHFRRGLGAVK